MIEIDYKKLKKFCEGKGALVKEVDYIEDGFLGKFEPPCMIYITNCFKCGLFKQRKILVLLHEMCHYFKYMQCGRSCEEACFEFEIICNCVLNEGHPIFHDFEAIERLGLQKPINFLKTIIDYCKAD